MSDLSNNELEAKRRQFDKQYIKDQLDLLRNLISNKTELLVEREGKESQKCVLPSQVQMYCDDLRYYYSALKTTQEDIRERQLVFLESVLILVKGTEKAIYAAKQCKLYNYKTFHKKYLGISRRHYYRYKEVYDNWDWLKLLNPSSYSQALRYIEQGKEKRSKELLKEKLVDSEMNTQEELDFLRTKDIENQREIDRLKKEIEKKTDLIISLRKIVANPNGDLEF